MWQTKLGLKSHLTILKLLVLGFDLFLKGELSASEEFQFTINHLSCQLSQQNNVTVIVTLFLNLFIRKRIFCYIVLFGLENVTVAE